MTVQMTRKRAYKSALKRGRKLQDRLQTSGIHQKPHTLE